MHETGDLVQARRFQQGEGAVVIGAHHGFGRENAAIHVRFGGEMHDRVGALFAYQRVDQRGIADISLHEAVAGIAIDGREILQIAGVGQLIEVDYT